MSTICLGCGAESGSHADVAKYSLTSLAGNYVLGMSSCTLGQFDAGKGNDFLTQNQRLAGLNKDGTKIEVKVSDNSFVTTAPSTLYGAGNQTCMVTTTEHLSFPNSQSISRRLVSRSCSSTCSTDDCEENKNIRSEATRTFLVDIQNSKLYLTESATKGVCISSKNGRHPVQTEYTKQ